MKSSRSIFFELFLLTALFNFCFSKDFDFFYFVQQGPGSYCNTQHSCCYPKTGKPATNFIIHGLWPNYKNGSWPSYCNPENPFNQSMISDLMGRAETSWPLMACPSSNNTKFCAHDWDKLGTCSESVLDQHSYFEFSLHLKDCFDPHILQNAGINADGKLYSLECVKEAIKEATGYVPGIGCNADASNNSQLYEIYLCVDKSASKFIECPVLPNEANCASYVEFPSF